MPQITIEPELLKALIGPMAKGLTVARSHPRVEEQRRMEWTWGDSWRGREDVKQVSVPDVFAGWAADGVCAETEAAFARFGPSPENRLLSFGPLGSYAVLDPLQLFNNVVRLSPADLSEVAAVETALKTIAKELERTTIRCEIYAPLLGVSLSADTPVRFPKGLLLRATTVDDINRWHDNAQRQAFIPSAAFSIELEFLRSAGADDMPTDGLEEIRASIVDARRAMAIYKKGRIGGGDIHMRAIDSRVMTAMLTRGSIDGTNHGSYTLSAQDVVALTEMACTLGKPAWPQLGFAIERLGEAEERSNTRDAILDAVIGLETLMTAGSDREGLRHKFSVHLAALIPVEQPAERRRRFVEAYDLYGIRSKIAHAGVNAPEYEIAGDKLTANAVADRARALLRATIIRMLKLDNIPTTGKKRDEFWDALWPDLLFGTRDE